MHSRRYGTGSGDIDTVDEPVDIETPSLSPGSVPEGPVSKAAGPRVPTELATEIPANPISDSGARQILDSLDVGVLIFDPQQNLRYANARHQHLIGLDLAKTGSMEAWLRAGCRDAEYAERVIRSWREHLWQKQLTRVFSLKNASDQLREIEFRPRLLKNGDLLLTLLDVTEARHAKDALRIAETKFDAVFQAAESGIALVDRTGRFLDVNGAFESLVGHSRTALRRMALSDCLAFSDIERFRAAEVALIQEASESAIEVGGIVEPNLLHRRDLVDEESIRFRPRVGEVFPAELTLSLVLGPGGHPLFTLVSVHTEPSSPPSSETSSQARNRALLEAIPDLILVLDGEGTIRDLIPPNGGGWRGARPTAAWIGQRIADCWPGFDRISIEQVRKTIEEDEIRSWRLREESEELLLHREIRAAATGGDSAVVVVMDSTDEAEAREALARQAVAFRHLEEGIILTNLRGRIEDWNEAAARAFGYRLEEVAGDGLSRLYASPEEAESLNREISRSLSENGRWEARRTFFRRDGSQGKAEVWLLPVEEAGEPRSLLGIHRELQNRSLDEESAEQMQHRWRNQLQTISSLLSLERETVRQGGPQPETSDSLLKAQCRLRAAGRLHDCIPSVTDPVPLVSYIQGLSEDLRHLVNGSEANTTSFPVRPAKADNPVLTGFETAFAFGLLFVELAVPVLQWRPSEGDPRSITPLGGRMILGHYSGHPLMRAVVPSAAMRSLSVPTLQILTEQLQGNLQVQHHEGRAGWTLRFPAGD